MKIIKYLYLKNLYSFWLPHPQLHCMLFNEDSVFFQIDFKKFFILYHFKFCFKFFLVMVVVVCLPDPFLKIRAQINSAESQQLGNPPDTRPKV